MIKEGREGKRRGIRVRVISSAAIIIALLIAWGLILYYGPDTSKIPAPENMPPQVTTSTEPGSKVLTGQSPRPKREPHVNTSPVVRIYVVNSGISYRWGFDSVIAGWNKAKWTNLIKAKQCPVAEYCITVLEDKKLRRTLAGESIFTDGYAMAVRLNPILKEPFEAQSTLCHEFGHLLGAPHITGTANTCMTPVDDFYRITPTSTDLQTVDRLGMWELEKMYENSGKTLDVRPQPK